MTVEQAVQELNAAQDKLSASVKGTDEYFDARAAYADAREAYDNAYARKLSSYPVGV